MRDSGVFRRDSGAERMSSEWGVCAAGTRRQHDHATEEAPGPRPGPNSARPLCAAGHAEAARTQGGGGCRQGQVRRQGSLTDIA
jgi:hypothetical protein